MLDDGERAPPGLQPELSRGGRGAGGGDDSDGTRRRRLGGRAATSIKQ